MDVTCCSAMLVRIFIAQVERKQGEAYWHAVEEGE